MRSWSGPIAFFERAAGQDIAVARLEVVADVGVAVAEPVVQVRQGEQTLGGEAVFDTKDLRAYIKKLLRQSDRLLGFPFVEKLVDVGCLVIGLAQGVAVLWLELGAEPGAGQSQLRVDDQFLLC